MYFKYRSPFARLVSKRTALECSKSDFRVSAKLRSNSWLQRCLRLLILITFFHCILFAKYFNYQSVLLVLAYCFVKLLRVILVLWTCLNQFETSTVDLLTHDFWPKKTTETSFNWGIQLHSGIGRPSYFTLKRIGGIKASILRTQGIPICQIGLKAQNHKKLSQVLPVFALDGCAFYFLVEVLGLHFRYTLVNNLWWYL